MGAKVKITERAVVARLNRKMKNEDRCVRKSKGARMLNSCGEYYVLNFRRNWVDFHHIDLEEFAREYEVLKDWEMIERESESNE